MARTTTLLQGRKAFRQQHWADAYTLLSSADSKSALDPADLEQLAKAAYLVGKESQCIENWIRAHQQYLSREHPVKAAHCAFWLGMIFFNQGDKAQGGGWIARAGRLVNRLQTKSVVHGFLLVPEALQKLREGNVESARDLFQQATEAGVLFNNPDLMAFGRLGHGQALIQRGSIAEGTTLLDETMVSVVSGETSPIVAGIVYCAVIETCQKVYDLQRAQEWTTALSRWCDSHPDMVPYRGQCMVRRAEIMQVHGKWSQALDDIRQACELSQSSSPPATGEAFYRKAELHRLQGDFTEAEKSYRQANKRGRNPQPGLALLRLAQGQRDTAKASICQVEAKNQDPMGRSRILPAYIDIMLATNNIPAAKEAAHELYNIAEKLEAPFLQAVAGRSKGSVLLAEEDPEAALEKLRRASKRFNKMNASYEAACCQVLIGRACRELGDYDTADMAFDAAKWTFQQLGASPDLDYIHSLAHSTDSVHTHGLTPRERQVLLQLATGKTNKVIADELFISERTVDRHVSNILSKLNVPSRAAATAYAYEHDLL